MRMHKRLIMLALSEYRRSPWCISDSPSELPSSAIEVAISDY